MNVFISMMSALFRESSALIAASRAGSTAAYTRRTTALNLHAARALASSWHAQNLFEEMVRKLQVQQICRRLPQAVLSREKTVHLTHQFCLCSSFECCTLCCFC